MSLDPSYLEYPHRRRGLDHDLFPWSALHTRPPITWPNGKRVAVVIVISCEFFPLTPTDTPFRAPGHMQTPFPDYRHFTARDYGSRLGVPRLVEAVAKVGAHASFAMNSRWAARFPDLARSIVAAGHEVVAHSTDMNGTIATGLPEADERALITASLEVLHAVTGVRPSGWLSIARSQSWNTPRLLAEAGLRYCLDWVNDELPYRMTTPAGALVNLPLNHELSDRQIIATCQQSAASFKEQLLDAHDWLDGEVDAHGGRLLPVHLTPYISGLPYRIDAIEQLLVTLASRPGVWFARGADVVDASGA
ncbi:polysaccharide deacetylase [Polymorphobacter multimanifer]|uniref:Chitooligosaccharide deacetylase n=1 Tax=Polymorphobacter multimanifer TaxID=1070431 RepID=A0A841L5K9_9SPHN|nr:polysaccharide deacetylase family protein [Polymorphobacter multimanifer]MBB6228189.1 peptidoglycan/xylan/chitin deacetylase (PgdA/CDA1 family) [Polymorphobacter multimanifer]GGI93742.1 polysaccharide deacetylase [Polymorphobacter multimanifer]